MAVWRRPFFFLAWEGLTHKVVGDALRLRIAEAASLVWRVIWVGIHGEWRERALDRFGLVYLLHIYIYSTYTVEVGYLVSNFYMLTIEEYETNGRPYWPAT